MPICNSTGERVEVWVSGFAGNPRSSSMPMPKSATKLTNALTNPAHLIYISLKQLGVATERQIKAGKAFAHVLGLEQGLLFGV